MRTIKLLCLAFMATAAFSVVGVVGGVDSAAALLFLTENGVVNELFTLLPLNSAAKKVVIENQKGPGSTVECDMVDGHGFILNKTDVADKILLTFHSCEAFFFGVNQGPCLSAGELPFTIKSLELDGLLVTLLNGHYGLLILGEANNHIASATCGTEMNFKVVVTGNVVGEFVETKAESEVSKREAELEFKKGAERGEPEIKDYWTLQKIVVPKLEAAIGDAASEANLLATVDIKPVKPMKFCHK